MVTTVKSSGNAPLRLYQDSLRDVDDSPHRFDKRVPIFVEGHTATTDRFEVGKSESIQEAVKRGNLTMPKSKETKSDKSKSLR